MSATAGWYPDPGGGQGLYRYWDGQAWSAATTGDPGSAPPPQGLVNPGSAAGTAGATAHANYGSGSSGSGSYGSGSYGQGGYGQGGYGQGSYGQGSGAQGGSAFGAGTPGTAGAGRQPYGQTGGPGQPGVPPYLQYQKKRSGIGWWVGAGALLLVLVVVAVFAIRAATDGGRTVGGGGASGQASADQCPPERSDSPSAAAPPADGRVHGGPVSYPQLGSPWGAPRAEVRVPFGVNVLSQEVTVEANYAPDSSWVASVLVGELQAGDGFFTPQQGSQIVVKCILGKFYGGNQVNSDVVVDKATTIDGHEAWVVESKLTFDIPNLQTKGERLIVAIVQAGTERSGLFYASIPDTTPQLLQPARDALSQLKVDG